MNSVPRTHKISNKIWNFYSLLNPPTPLCLFLDIMPVISFQEFIFSCFSHWLGSFSRRIDLARFRVGTIIFYRPSDREFSSVGRFSVSALIDKNSAEKQKNTLNFKLLVPKRFRSFVFILNWSHFQLILAP